MLVAAWWLGCSGDKDTTVPDHTGTTEDTGPEQVTELFPQDMISPVDILWVLDGTWDFTDGLSDAIDPMWEVLLLADPSWQMGVLDATASGSRYALLTKQWSTWPPPNNAFSVSNGTLAPRFDETLYSALELRGTNVANKDFLRSGASLYTIYVTDADEDASATDTITRRDFLSWYEGLREDARIAVITDAGNQRYWKDRTVGASTFVAGNNEKVVVRDAILEAVGLQTKFVLEHEPMEPPTTVEVIYRDHATEYELDTDYAYDPVSREIAFKKVIPPPDSVVRVRFLVAPETSTTGG